MSYRSTGSYYKMTPDMYSGVPAGTPGWQLAPVPGWGMNPARSGPPVLATAGRPQGDTLPAYSKVSLPRGTMQAVRGAPGGLGDSESSAQKGYIALAGAGGIFLGWFLAWAYWREKGLKAR